MSAMDSIKEMADKAKHMLSGHSEQTGKVVDKGGDFVDDKTGGKYAKHVDSAQDAVKKTVSDSDESAGETPSEPRTPGPADSPEPDDKPE